MFALFHKTMKDTVAHNAEVPMIMLNYNRMFKFLHMLVGNEGEWPGMLQEVHLGIHSIPAISESGTAAAAAVNDGCARIRGRGRGPINTLPLPPKPARSRSNSPNSCSCSGRSTHKNVDFCFDGQ